MVRAASQVAQPLSALLYFDLALGLHRVGLLGCRDPQHALVEDCIHFRLVDGVREPQAALEGAEAALGEVVGLVLLLVLVLLLALDGEQSAGDGGSLETSVLAMGGLPCCV
jgi:hypothetical protein